MISTAATIDNGKIDAHASAGIRAYLAENPGPCIISIMPRHALAAKMAIMPLESIVEWLDSIGKLAERTIDATNAPEIIEFLNELSAWLPHVGKVQASAKYYLLLAERTAMDYMPEGINRLSATERRRWAQGQVAEFAALYENIERLGAAMTHRCDALRTLLSYEKQQMILNNMPSSK